MLWIGAATVQNFPGYLVLRFLTGFFGTYNKLRVPSYSNSLGSPALATGGASFGDIYPLIKVPYALVLWGASSKSTL
jgi:DHA1 family multidrug resistance protein-like MFS transporter